MPNDRTPRTITPDEAAAFYLVVGALVGSTCRPWLRGTAKLLRALAATARANCYIVVPPDHERIAAGEMVAVHWPSR